MDHTRGSRENLRKSLTRLAIAAGGLIAPLAALASAPMPLHVTEVRDSELADLRGRYVNANRVMYFGIEMYTQWQTGNGAQHAAGLKLDVDLQNGAAPVVGFRPVVSIAAAGVDRVPSGDHAQVNGAGLANVTGVVQGIQVAGDGNRVNNDLSLRVTSDAAPAADTSGGNPPAAVAASGDAVVVAGTGPNSLGVAIRIPGQGQVVQRIRGGGHGILQSAQVVSDMNRIHNVMQISVGLRAMTGAPTANVGAALQNLRGIPLQGMY